MHLLYSLNRHDVVRGLLLHTTFWAYWLGLCAIVSAFTFSGLIIGGEAPIALRVGFLTTEVVPLLLLGLGLTLALRFILIPWRIAQIDRQNPLLYRDLELFIDETGIRMKAPREEERWEWSDLRGFKEDTSIFLICVSRSMHYVVPKRALSAEESVQFRDLLQQHLKKM